MSSSRVLLLLLVPTIAFAGAKASKFKPEHRKGANYWNAQSAVDNNPDTCWMVPGESPNRGEWIELDLPKSTVDKIGMNVGWVINEEAFTDHARVKAIKVEAFSLNDRQELSPRGSATASFQDDAEWQIVDIDDLQVGEDLFGGKLRISIADIYEGRDFPNLAISELRVYLTEFDTQAALMSSSDSIGTNVVELMQDDNGKTFWATAAEGATFTVEASGFGLSSIGIQQGPKSHARPKTIEVSAPDAGNITLTHVLEDITDMQYVLVPAFNGYTGGAFGSITVKVIDTYPGDDPNVAIAEIASKATNYEGF